MTEFKELDYVVLKSHVRPDEMYDGYLKREGRMLLNGAAGTIVNVSGDQNKVYDVEFVDNEGRTACIAVIHPKFLKLHEAMKFFWYKLHVTYGPEIKSYAEDYRFFSEALDEEEKNFIWHEWVKMFADKHRKGGVDRVFQLPSAVHEEKQDRLQEQIKKRELELHALSLTPKLGSTKGATGQ